MLINSKQMFGGSSLRIKANEQIHKRLCDFTKTHYFLEKLELGFSRLKSIFGSLGVVKLGFYDCLLVGFSDRLN